ncbi:MAG: hypothetical protein IJV40_16040, partial [Oscillospiraceae bacterium]|nr:hypothetical protein [Oscillospiraceae bacterium]
VAVVTPDLAVATMPPTNVHKERAVGEPLIRIRHRKIVFPFRESLAHNMKFCSLKHPMRQAQS